MSTVSEYVAVKKTGELPRLPLEGSIDLTYRCNNACRHCWLRLPANAPERAQELSFDEIRRIADEARALGCRSWHISGGEPMLRPDFPEIFDYLTRKASRYSLNTNGTLITPAIAQRLRRPGTKMIALYGATMEVYDAVTRHPGGFEELMRGFAYLREAGAGFIVQLIPMRANWHQWDRMIELAKSLSPHYRVGAPWLFLSADGSAHKNREIVEQRLAPLDVIELDKPDPAYSERMEEINAGATQVAAPAGCAQDGQAPDPPPQAESECRISANGDDRLFARCIAARRDFHIDAYGKMTFCCYVKDPALRYDLRRGTVREAWDKFIPSLADKVRGGGEYHANCGSCERRADCRWCAVYSYLETGRYSAPLPYLCSVAQQARQFRVDWQDKHRRYFRIAGITVRVESDLDFDEVKFHKEFAPFAVAGPGDDNVTLRHIFELPDLKGKDLGKELYRKAPWAISRQNGTWYYRGILPQSPFERAMRLLMAVPGIRRVGLVESQAGLHRVAVFNAGHTHGTIYNPPRDAERIRTDGWSSLALFPTDQIWLAPLLADRHAALIHSAAVILNGQGLLFVGHSEAGKSTTVRMLKGRAEILCDDRNIVRRWPEGWRVHGTWSHGDVEDVSSASAPLRAILFLRQDTRNAITPLTDRKGIWKRLLATLIKPMVTAEWWHKEVDVLARLVSGVPFYTMDFDRSGAIVAELAKLAEDVHPPSSLLRLSPEVL